MTVGITPERGVFISFEGGEGTGKSTQSRLLRDRLAASGISALVTREPGGSAGAERIRALVLDPDHPRFAARAEALLFYAARADHLEMMIAPTLAAGHWVICDRFSDSTRAYQGALSSVDSAFLKSLEHFVVGEQGPDLTILLDLPAEIGLARAAARRGTAGIDGFEREGADFHQALRRAYLDLASAEPLRIVVIDASGNAQEVADAVWNSVRLRLAARFTGKR